MSEVRLEAFSIDVGDKVVSAVMCGGGPHVVVACGEDGARHDAWDALADACVGEGVAFVSYTDMGEGVSSCEVLDAVLDSVADKYAPERVVLVGAGLGATSALLSAGTRGDGLIDGVIAISPKRRDGEIELISTGDLRMITCPKLVIASEFEDNVGDARDIFADLEDPRRVTLYPDDRSGTGLFRDHRESLTLELAEFIRWAFSR